MKAKLTMVLAGGAKVATAESISAQTGEDDIEDVMAASPVQVTSNIDDDDDDTMSYFAKLADED